jgi:nicotinate-nucleotide adenylyltransferase
MQRWRPPPNLWYPGALELIRKAAIQPARLGILPGAFNPPTRAHLALARSALGFVDEVLFALPSKFPHKTYSETTMEQRLQMLRAAVEAEPRFSIGVTDRGLFIDIARAARKHFPAAELFFLCGRDAAERIVNWNYGQPDATRHMLEEFRLLVAPRHGDYVPPEELRFAIGSLPLSDYDECSGTQVRERVARGETWHYLVPAEIVPMVEEFYGKPR